MTHETQYIDTKFIKKNTMEYRDYQVNLANLSQNNNCLVVLPTGLGKTSIAIQIIANYLTKITNSILFLAPTKVLVHQHYNVLKNNLTIFDISLITGEDLIAKRKKLWKNTIICATPEITQNDLLRNMILPSDFGLIIFDEAHRSIGNYAYSIIAKQFLNHNTRIIGMTATLPSEKYKVNEIISKLNIKDIQYRTEQSNDVKQYVQNIDIKWIKTDLPPEMQKIQKLIKTTLDEKYMQLQKNGVPISLENKSLTKLLNMRNYVLNKNKMIAKLLFVTIRLHYALNTFESYGVTSFLRFCTRLKQKPFGNYELFNDHNFSKALSSAVSIQQIGIEHSKIMKLKEIITKLNSKTIIFTSYRDSVEIIHKKLVDMGIKAGFLIGKTGKTGLKQKQQIETVQKFRNNEYNVLVATKVGEEGLDISEVNNIIFYDNVPSSIRFIQRKGRTGRKYAGTIFILITRNTIDETYYWISQRKSLLSQNMSEIVSNNLKRMSSTKNSLDQYF